MPSLAPSVAPYRVKDRSKAQDWPTIARPMAGREKTGLWPGAVLRKACTQGESRVQATGFILLKPETCSLLLFEIRRRLSSEGKYATLR
jgi:hypothetical protein